MGTFFLIFGTILFFAGLGCLLALFASVVSRLRLRESPLFGKKRTSKRREIILAIVGIVLIVCAQMTYWFENEIRLFVPFDDTIPQMQVNFFHENLHTPKAILQTVDQNNRSGVQIVPVTSDQVVFVTEVITWQKVFAILGLKDCYHISGIYFGDTRQFREQGYSIPDYALNGGQSSLVSLIDALGSVFPAEVRVMITPALETDPQFEYIVRIDPDSVYYSQSIDNLHSADYPYMLE